MKRFFRAAPAWRHVFRDRFACARRGSRRKTSQRSQRTQEWLSLLPDAERAKLRAAKERALKDPAVQTANQRRKQAEAEYRELLYKEMLKTDPSLTSLLETMTELKKRPHEY
jgi:hypothetical protein